MYYTPRRKNCWIEKTTTPNPKFIVTGSVRPVNKKKLTARFRINEGPYENEFIFR